MSTEKKTTSTAQYDPQSMTRYQGAQNKLYQTYSQMVANPFGGPQYQMGLQMQMGAANQLSMNAVRNAMRGFNMSGTGQLTGGARASLLSGLSRSSSAMRQQGFLSNWQNALANQQFGANVLGQMQPLQTGQTQVQKTSGLGTWLPQVLGAGLGIASAFIPGASAAGKAIGGAAAGFGSSAGANEAQLGTGGLGAFMQNNQWNPIPQSNLGGGAGSIIPSNFNLGSMYGR